MEGRTTCGVDNRHEIERQNDVVAKCDAMRMDVSAQNSSHMAKIDRKKESEE